VNRCNGWVARNAKTTRSVLGADGSNFDPSDISRFTTMRETPDTRPLRASGDRLSEAQYLERLLDLSLLPVPAKDTLIISLTGLKPEERVVHSIHHKQARHKAD
jgi:hypothetical protein